MALKGLLWVWASAEGSRAKERELPQGLERGVAKFCQGSEEERTGWSNEGFFLLFFFPK